MGLPTLLLRISLNYSWSIQLSSGRKYDIWCNSSQSGSTPDMASIMASSDGKKLSRQSCAWEDSTAHAGSTYGSSSSVYEEEGLGYAMQSIFAWYAINVVGNDTSVLTSPFEGLNEGRIQGSSIWVVRKRHQIQWIWSPTKTRSNHNNGCRTTKGPHKGWIHTYTHTPSCWLRMINNWDRST